MLTPVLAMATSPSSREMMFPRRPAGGAETDSVRRPSDLLPFQGSIYDLAT